MVLSADLESILLNEGDLYDGLDEREVATRLADAKARFKSEAFKAATDKGVRLGMSQPQVRKLLGTPDREMWSAKFKARELIYRFETKKDREGISTRYSNCYLFRNDKLYFIELAVDAMGGP